MLLLGAHHCCHHHHHHHHHLLQVKQQEGFLGSLLEPHQVGGQEQIPTELVPGETQKYYFLNEDEEQPQLLLVISLILPQ